jgi:hypothetical protein
MLKTVPKNETATAGDLHENNHGSSNQFTIYNYQAKH